MNKTLADFDKADAFEKLDLRIAYNEIATHDGNRPTEYNRRPGNVIALCLLKIATRVSD